MGWVRFDFERKSETELLCTKECLPFSLKITFKMMANMLNNAAFIVIIILILYTIPI